MVAELSCCYHHPRENRAPREYTGELSILLERLYGHAVCSREERHDRHVSLYCYICIIVYVSICIYEKIIPKLIELKCLRRGVRRGVQKS